MVIPTLLRLLLLSLFVYTAAYGMVPGSVTASVDRSSVTVQETFNLTIRFAGGSAETPEWSALEEDFEIVRRSEHSSPIGPDQRPGETIWELALRPLDADVEAVPSMRIGSLVTQRLPLAVMPVTDSAAPPEAMIEMSVSSSRPFMHAEVIGTLRQYLAKGAYAIREPQLVVRQGDASVQASTAVRTYELKRHGRMYQVSEKRYSIVPRHSGQIVIEPARLVARVAHPIDGARIARFRSHPLVLEVRPAVSPPPNMPTAAWLPAKEIKLAVALAPSSNTPRSGEPVTLTIALSAQGMHARDLPPVDFILPAGMKLFADKPELKGTFTNEGTRAERVSRFVLLPTSEGNYALEPIELPWFSVAQERWEVARASIPVLNVAPGITPSVQSAPNPKLSQQPSVRRPRISPAVWLLIALGTAAIVALGWCGIRTRMKSDATSVRRILRQIDKACAAGDATAAHDGLMRWAAHRWPLDPPRSLGAIADRLPEPFAAAVRSLSRVRYGNASSAWSPHALSAALPNLRRFPLRTTTANLEGLRPLWPDPR